MKESEDKKIVVTGGAGFIGSHIVDKLIEQGHEVLVLDNLMTGKKDNIEKLDRIEFVEADVRDYEAVEDAIRGYNYVIHEAAFLGVSRVVDAPWKTMDIIVEGTRNVLKAAEEHNIEKVVHASSSEVYGEMKGGKHSEDDSLCATTNYGEAKLLSERYCKTSDVSTVSVRYFNVYGPRQDPEAGVVPKFCKRAAEGKPLELYGGGQQTRDFTYIEDAAMATIKCLELESDDVSLNIGTGKETSIKELAHKIAKITDREVEIKETGSRGHDFERRCADTEKMRKELGFKSKWGLYRGLKKSFKDISRAMGGE